MERVLTKEKAHRLFGELYRRPRPPELQKQVEQIVKDNKDIFVRLKLIEDLEKKYTNEKNPSAAKSALPQQPLKKGLETRDAKAFGKEASSERRSQGERQSPRQEGQAKASQIPPQQKRKKGPGFFERLFGRTNRRIAVWGRDTGALHSRFLQFELSTGAQTIFLGLNEDDNIRTLKALRFAAGGIWEYVDAASYNTLIAVYQFFSDYIKYQNIFSRTENPMDWIDETLSMQKNYANLLRYNGYKKFILEVLPNYVGANEKYNSLLPSLDTSMRHIVSLGNRKPNLKDSIIAFYVLAENNLYAWEDLEKKLGVKEAIQDRFCAPQEVQVLIQQRIQNLKKKHTDLINETEEVKSIQKKYLAIDSNGNFDSNFLDHIIYDVVRRAYGEKNAVAHVIRSHKSQPHRLLFAILRDFNISYLPLLSASISVSGLDKVTESINIFSPNIFRERMDTFNQLLRAMDTYLRKYPGLSYAFPDFAKNKNTKIFDPSLEAFHRLVDQVNDLFKEIVVDMQSVLNNHEQANQEKIMAKGEGERQKFKAIEEIGNRPRYLPYADTKIQGLGRLSGKSLQSALINLLTHMYNYLYIFHDSMLRGLLHNSRKREIQKQKIEERLGRLGGKESPKE